MATALLLCKNFREYPYTGISKRQVDIKNLLEEVGFDVAIKRSIFETKFRKFDLICVQSFTNAWQLPFTKFFTNFVWFDPMDSWRLTRRSLFFTSVIKETLKYLRDVVCSKFLVFCNIISYCSLSDWKNDNIRFKRKFFILPPTISNKSNLLNLPDYGKRWVFVGSCHYTPNREAAEYLIRLASLGYFGDIPLHFYGSGYERFSESKGLFFNGLSNEKFLYGKQDIHLAPIWSGAGIKYKVVTPLSKGLKVISSPEGANGLISDSLKIGTSKNHFAKLILEEDFHSELRTFLKFEIDESEELKLFLKQIFRIYE